MLGRCARSFVILGFLAGCGGSVVVVPPPIEVPLPEGTEVVTPGIESYTTEHNGYTRARIDRSEGNADQAILAQFDDSSADSPAGYRNLITLTEARYADTMFIEVIAAVADDGNGGEEVLRVLRITTDQAPFNNIGSDGRLIAQGQFYFRGEAYVFASVDDEPLAVGKGRLENLMVDFDTGTAIIDIQTGYMPGEGSEIETSLVANDLDFNVVTGAFGGPVTLSTRSGLTGEIVTSEGVLRGNLHGDEPGLTRLVDDLTTSGLFSVGVPGDRLIAEGVFWGGQLLRAP